MYQLVLKEHSTVFFIFLNFLIELIHSVPYIKIVWQKHFSQIACIVLVWQRRR